MCGISGIFNYQTAKKVDLQELQRINDALKLRGPDGDGLWTNSEESVGFGHRRLSIIDLSTNANQPMHVDDLTITYNGEIYNYQALRNDLINKNIQFKTRSDTEVI